MIDSHESAPPYPPPLFVCGHLGNKHFAADFSIVRGAEDEGDAGRQAADEAKLFLCADFGGRGGCFEGAPPAAVDGKL